MDLGVKALKIQIVQELKPNDLPQRRTFGEWALESWPKNQIVFSDKLIFDSMNT